MAVRVVGEPRFEIGNQGEEERDGEREVAIN
jgi:hypothetical protein